MVREWGRIGQAGTVRETWFETEGEAWAAGEQWRERKERRGYRAVGEFSQAGARPEAGGEHPSRAPFTARSRPIATVPRSDGG